MPSPCPSNHPPFPLIVAVLGGLASPASAQATLHEYRYGSSGALAVAGLGDVDGDGRPDFAIGLPRNAAHPQGFVEVRSGATGSLLHVAVPSGNVTAFGMVLRNVGDVDHDGIADLFAGAVTTVGQAPRGFVISGSDGHVLLGPFAGATFVEPAGDVDGDGTPDWIQSRNASSGPHAKVEVRSGKDASLLHSFDGAGFSAPQVAGVGDVDGDDRADFVIGDFEESNAVGDTWAGSVVVRAGGDGSELRREEGTAPFSYLGYLVNRVGDVDGDGVREYAVLDMTGQATTGKIHLRIKQAASGAVIRDLASEDFTPFGSRILDLGDMNGDGAADIGAGIDFWSGNPAPRVYSGATGRLLYRHFGGGQISFNYDVDAVGDVDGDGFADQILMGMESDGDAQEYVVRVVGGNDLWLTASTAHAYAGQTLRLSTGEGRPGNAVVIVLLDLGGAPLLLPLGEPATFDATGAHFVRESVPSGLTGLVATFQAFALAPSGRVIASEVEAVTFE